MKCPDCGADAERGQLVCIECGARLALEHRDPRGWQPALAVIAVVVAVAATTLAIVLGATGGEDDPEVALGRTEAAPAGETAPVVTAQGPQTETATTETVPTETDDGLAVWPADRRAHTVVLVTSSDEAGARNVAEEAARSGLEAGMIDSDDHDLGQDLFIVFAGTYESFDEAARAAQRLGERYPGAYPQLVEPAQSGQ
jgi:septal ring-binding cell division protein DamX